MVVLFIAGYACICILSIRGLILCKRLKKEINFSGSSMNLYYQISSEALGANIKTETYTTELSRHLYSKCIACVRGSAAIVVMEVLLGFIFG